MVEMSVPDGGGKNVVNVILVDFRGYDTLGEITVLTAAAIGMVALARAGRGQAHDGPGLPNPAVPPPVRVTRLVTLEVSMRLLFTVVMVGSLYLLFVGHNLPGGGFAGGIVAGAAIALRYISGGITEVRRLSRGQPWLIVGGGRSDRCDRCRHPAAVRWGGDGERDVDARIRRCSARSSSRRCSPSTPACISSWSVW